METIEHLIDFKPVLKIIKQKYSEELKDEELLNKLKVLSDFIKDDKQNKLDKKISFDFELQKDDILVREEGKMVMKDISDKKLLIFATLLEHIYQKHYVINSINWDKDSEEVVNVPVDSWFSPSEKNVKKYKKICFSFRKVDDLEKLKLCSDKSSTLWIIE